MNSRKQEPALSSHTEIQLLVKAFETCTLPIENWTHRAHLAVGAYYAHMFSREEALLQMRVGIQRYNLRNNNPTGYNETITRLFLARMATDIELGLSKTTLSEEISRLVDVCKLEWIYSFYSKALIHSDKAKQFWVEPDLRPLDFLCET